MSEEKGLFKPILVGVVVTVVGGLILAILNGSLFPTKSTEETTVKPILDEKQLKIDYALKSRHVILGPNPGGVWAFSMDNKDNGKFLWHSIDLIITNKCDDDIYIDPDQFILSFSKEQEFDEKDNYHPTTEGMEFQTKRLIAKWLRSGESIEGRLTFRVRDDANDVSDDGIDILRYKRATDCQIKYSY